MKADRAVDERGRSLLRAGLAVRLAGWATLLLAGAYGVIGVVERAGGRYAAGLRFYGLVTMARTFLLGLAALSIAQLVNHLLLDTDRPPRLLRNGHKVLYAYAALALFAQAMFWTQTAEMQSTLAWYTFAPQFLMGIARVLVLVGLGAVLNRVLPIIRDWKTLA